jgi:hypothetical protein
MHSFFNVLIFYSLKQQLWQSIQKKQVKKLKKPCMK